MAKQGSKKARLGRGLSSLISTQAAADASSGQYQTQDSANEAASPSQNPPGEHVRTITLSKIDPNPYQPRTDFSEKELQELAESIKQQGILQPLVVTTSDNDGRYVVIAGERRLRAARLAGRESVPCLVREARTEDMAAWALIENLQRSDLNPIERAEGYKQYIERFELTQAQAAEKLGQPRTTIANHLRIAALQPEVRAMIREGQLSFGHGKVLAGLIESPDRQKTLAVEAVEKGWSVRQLEEAVLSDHREGEEPSASHGHARRTKPAYVRDLEERLTGCVGTRVAIRPGRGKNRGRIVIDYYNLEDFERIAQSLGLRIDDEG